MIEIMAVETSAEGSQSNVPLWGKEWKIAAVGVIISRTAILATEKRALHAPIDQMERLDFILRANLRSFDPRHHVPPSFKKRISRDPTCSHRFPSLSTSYTSVN
jgi:hypothetical protein